MQPVVIRFKEIESTNKYVKEHFLTLPDKCIVIADMQTNGKGRDGRRWISENEQNLYFTFHLKNLSKMQSFASYLTLLLAISAANALDRYLISTQWKVRIKEPNDLYISSYKIGGILAEALWIGSDLSGMALGIGINLDLSKGEMDKINQPAAGLKQFYPYSVDKEILFQHIAFSFYQNYDLFIEAGFQPFQSEYESKLVKFQCKRIMQKDGKEKQQ